MRTKDRHNTSSWESTPFGRLNRKSQTGRQLTIAEAFAEVATKH